MIDFANPSKIEPFFDVEAETRVRAPGQVYQVVFRASGTPNQMAFDLSSDPPLSTVDIVSLLFGDSQNLQDAELGALRSPNRREQDLVAARAARLLASPISSEVGRVVEQTLGVDSVQITPSLSGSSTDESARLTPAARLTLGKRVSDKLYLTYSRVLNASTRDIYQDRGLGRIPDVKALRVATKRRPTDDEYTALAFAGKVCKHVKSNAIVFTTQDRTLGIGAGQMSSLDSVRIAVMKARFPLAGTVLASDAFFPFRDGLDEAARAGVTAVIQPGGSLKDEEVIAAANEHDIAMIFSGMRQFPALISQFKYIGTRNDHHEKGRHCVQMPPFVLSRTDRAATAGKGNVH